MLSQPALSPRGTERGAVELINAWFRAYFTGQPHKSPLGDVTFPLLGPDALLFNQAELPSQPDGPQIHVIVRIPRKHETWFAAGNLSDWEIEIANPASGVNYGYTHGRIEEAVHGKLLRRIDGLNIRWQTQGGDYAEQVFDGTAWSTVRLILGASDLRWIRQGGNYLEQGFIGGTWQTQRTVAPVDAIWDGSKILVCADAELSIYARVFSGGSDGDKADQQCRALADNIKEMLESDARADLGQKGIQHPRIRSGPTAMAGGGVQVRLIVATAELRYYSPRLH